MRTLPQTWLILPGVVLALVMEAVGWLLAAAPPPVLERGVNLVTNGGFENPGGWAAVGSGFSLDQNTSHTGRRSLRCQGDSLDSCGGAKQVVNLPNPIKHPFRISAWSRAENAEVGQDYDLYLDLFYEDGTPLWGQIAHFPPGTHDWERAEFTFEVAKPVKRIEVHLLFRKARGTVWFDDIQIELAPFVFTRTHLLPGLYGAGSLAAALDTSLPAQWSAWLEGPDRKRSETKTGSGPLRLEWTGLNVSGPNSQNEYRFRVTATDTLLGQTVVSQRPVLLGDGGKREPLVVWTESSMRRVMPQALPDKIPSKPSASLALAADEYESFQVVLQAAPGEPARKVRVQTSDLVCPTNGGRIPAAQIQWHQVGYVKVEEPNRHPAIPEAAPGWWPDPLLPVREFAVAPGFAQPVWVTVRAPLGTAPGNYSGSLAIKAGGIDAIPVELNVEVYGFALPRPGHLKTAFALMDGFLERVYGKPLSPELRRRYGDFLLQHRLNPDDISRTAPPAIDDLRHYKGRGFNAFNILNLVEERGPNAWVCFSPLQTYNPRFKNRLIERLDPYVAQLRQEGLIDRAYIYTFDERGPEFFPTIREYFGMIRQRYPEVRTLTTAYVPQDPNVMRDLNVDWNCPLSSVYRLPAADKCRAEGLQVWAYICCGPRFPYANWMADDPLIEARLIWWQAYHQKFDGFLYWGLNIWDQPTNTKPIDPAQGPLLPWSIRTGSERLYGDGRLLYPGQDGPIGSIRLANIRDGLEDYEYLWLLSRRAADSEEARRACLPVTESLTQFTRDPSVVGRQRERVARLVEGK